MFTPRDGGSATDRYPHEPKPLSGLGMPKATPRLDVFRGRVLCCPSANGTPTRNGCRGSWRWPGSRTWNRRTATSGSCTCRGSTVSSRARRGRRGRRSCPWRTPADSTTSKCEVHERTVGRDNCVSFERLALQLPGDRRRPHYMKARVRVRRHLDGHLSVWHGPRLLQRYGADGGPVSESLSEAA